MRRADTPGPTARRRARAAACARTGRRSPRGTAPMQPVPSEYPTATRSSAVCDESKAFPMSGSATLATARFRLATAATRIREMSTSPDRRRAGGRQLRADGAGCSRLAAGHRSPLPWVGVNGAPRQHPPPLPSPGGQRRISDVPTPPITSPSETMTILIASSGRHEIAGPWSLTNWLPWALSSGPAWSRTGCGR